MSYNTSGGAVDERIVRMEFQNDQFEKGVKESIRSLDDLKKALKIEESAESLKSVETNLASMQQQMARTAGEAGNFSKLIDQALDPIERKINKIKNDIIQFPANQLVSLFDNIFSKPLKDGMDEYEEKMGRVQTLTNAVKWSQFGGDAEAAMDAVNGSLDRLNTYADKTIYSFKDMTQAFTKFAQQASSLDEAEDAIVGLYNASAYYGLNKQQGGMVSYNMAQALGVGSMKLMDWKSFELAGMAGTDVKENIIAVAHALGKLDDEGHVIGATGKAAKEAIVDVDSFRETLQYDWFDKDVLMAWMQLYSGTLPDNVAKQLEEMGVPVREIAEDALKASSEIKSFSQLWDTLGEALGTGWGRTFEIIFGDFSTAKERLTYIGTKLQDIIDFMSNMRNWHLEQWLGIGKGVGDTENGVEKLTSAFENFGDSIENAYEGIHKIINALTVGFGQGMLTEPNKRNGFGTVLSNIGITPDSIQAASEKLKQFTSDFKWAFSSTASLGRDIETGEINPEKFTLWTALYEIGRAAGAVTGIITDFLGLAMKGFGKLLAVLAPVGTAFLNIVGFIASWITKLAKGIRKTKTFDKVLVGINIVLEAIGSAAKGVLDAVNAGLTWLGEKLSNIKLEDILSIVGEGLMYLVGVLGILIVLGAKLVGGILGRAINLIRDLASALKDLGQRGLSWIGGQLDNPESPLSRVRDALAAFIAPLEGEDTMGLTEYIKAKWHQLDPIFDVMQEGLQNFLTKIFTMTGEEDPSAKAEAVIQSMIDTIDGVKEKLRIVLHSLEDFFGPVEHAAGTLKADGSEYTFFDEVNERFTKLTPITEMIKQSFEDFIASLLGVFGIEDPDAKIQEMETKVTGLFQKIQTAFGNIADAVTNWLGGGEEGTGIFGTLQEKFKDIPTTIGNIKQLLVDIIEAIVTAFAPSSKGEGEAGADGESFVDTFADQLEIVEASFGDLTTNLEGVAQPIEENMGSVEDSLTTINDFVKMIKEKLKQGLEYLMSDDFDMTAFTNRMIEIAHSFGLIALEFGGAGALSGIGKAGKGIGKLMENMTEKKGVLGTFLNGGSLKDIVKAGNKAQNVSSVVQNIDAAGSAFLKIAGGVALIATAAEIMTKMNDGDWTAFDEALKRLAGIFASVSFIELLGSTSKFSSGNGLKDFLKVGIALNLIVWSIEGIINLLQKYDKETIDNAFEGFRAILMDISLAEMFTSLEPFSGNGLKGLINLGIGLKLAVWALSDIVGLVKQNTPEDMNTAMDKFLKVLEYIVGAEGFTSLIDKIPGGQNGNSLKGLIGLGVALKLAVWALSDIVDLVTHYDSETMQKAMNDFIDILLLFDITKAVDGVTNAMTGNTGSLWTFVSYAGALWAAVSAVKALVDLADEASIGKVQAGITQIAELMGTFAILMVSKAVGDFFGPDKPLEQIISYVGTVAAFALSLASAVIAIQSLAESNIDTDRITAISNGLSEMFVGMAGLIGAVGVASALPGGQYTVGLAAALALVEFIGAIGAIGMGINALEALAPEQMQAFEDGIYKMGDLIHTFVEGILGTRDADSMAEGADKMKDIMSAFSEIGDDIDLNAVETGAKALEAVALAANSIPNEGGFLAMIVGDNSLGKFAENMGSLGSGLVTLNNAVKSENLQLSTFQNVASILKYFQSTEYPVANAGAFDAAARLKSTVKYVKDASNNAKMIDETGFQKAKDALEMLDLYVGILDRLKKSGLDMAKDKFGNAVGEGAQMSEGLMTALNDVFADSGKAYDFGMWMGNIYNGFFETSEDQTGAATTAAENMVGLFTDYFDTTGKEGFEECGKQLIAGFIEGMQSKTEDATTAAGVFTTALMDEIRSNLDINSPSGFTIDSMGDKMQEFVDGFGGDISGMDPTSFMNGFTDFFGNGITDMLSSDQFTGVIGNFMGSDGGVLGMVSEYLPSFSDFGGDVVTHTATGMNDNNSSVQDSTSKVVTTVSVPLDDLSNSAYTWGSNVTIGLANGLRDSGAMEALSSAVSAVASPIQNIGANQLKEHSPSKLTYGFGMYASLGLANGLADYAYAVEKSTDTVVDTMTGGLSDYSMLLAMGIDPEPTIRPVLDLSGIEADIGVVNSMFGDMNVGRAQTNNYANRAMSRKSGVEEAINGVNPEIYSVVLGLRDDVRQLRGELSNLQVVMDGSALVGQIAHRMDQKLGANASLAGRGN